jgi:NADH:ubiquinone oxidoreductase subunit F (NADH-binding)
MTVHRVLDERAIQSLDDHVAAGGGRGLDAARRLGAVATIEEVEASGLRGRGGAGFPTGRKWRTVAENRSDAVPTTVVVNAAEGEPGTFKDRAILRQNPYRVLEGALIAALAVGADAVVVATKATFTEELGRLRTALEALRGAGWCDGVDVSFVEGPSEYLFGEETALLEVVAGRQPFPRIAPPFRHGVDEIGSGAASAAGVSMASPSDATVAPPTLVDNVETLANVPGILAEGPAWFRSVGTEESPGTVVCTITGRSLRHGVGEFPMGTPLLDVISEVGGGARPGVVAAMSGVANPLVPAALFDTPVSYEGMQAIGSGLGAAGFILFDDTTDLVAVAAGVSRFLGVESCGQCTPCKQDGVALADLFDRARRSDVDDHDLDEIRSRLASVSQEARCFLALQHQAVGESILSLFPDALRAHLRGGPAGESAPVLVAPLVDIVDGRAVLDETQAAKQPDWTYSEVDSGRSPADRLDESRSGPD